METLPGVMAAEWTASPLLPPWPAGCVSKIGGAEDKIHLQNQSYFREELSLHILWMMNVTQPQGPYL